MNILITGGAGFIGSHLAESLVKLKHKVFILDNFVSGNKKNLSLIKDKITIYKSDIRHLKKIRDYFKNINVVFHLAALAEIVPSIKYPQDYYETNVTGTFNVLSACIQHKVKKIIYTASASCYGIPKKVPTSENDKIDPRYPYALTKRLGEELILHWGKIYNLQSTSLRLFNVYGPRSRTSGAYGAMFGVFLAQKFFNKPFTVIGDGSQKRDFTFVNDVVSALISVLNNKKVYNKIFNVGTGKPVSVNKVVKLLKGRVIRIPKRPGEPNITYADNKKIKKITNWSPKIDIKEGIKILLKNIDYWKTAPIWNVKKINKETKLWFKYVK